MLNLRTKVKLEITSMMKILFIHGLNGGQNGGTATALKSQLGEQAQVFAPAFSNDLHTFDNALANIELAKRTVSEEGIDLVIGSSMGGFTALQLSGVPTIVVNPCMRPSEHLAGLMPGMTPEELDKFRKLEDGLNPSDYAKENTYALFAMEDELFSYKSLFNSLYGAQNLSSIPGTHRNSPERVRDYIVPLITSISEAEDK